MMTIIISIVFALSLFFSLQMLGDVVSAVMCMVKDKTPDNLSVNVSGVIMCALWGVFYLLTNS